MRSERRLWWPGCSAPNLPIPGANGFWPCSSASRRSTTWTMSPSPSPTPVPPSRSGSMPTVWAGSSGRGRSSAQGRPGRHPRSGRQRRPRGTAGVGGRAQSRPLAHGAADARYPYAGPCLDPGRSRLPSYRRTRRPVRQRPDHHAPALQSRT